MSDTNNTPWISAHRGTKKDIAIGRDYLRLGPENEVENPDAQCVHVFGNDKLQRAELIVTAVNAYEGLLAGLRSIIDRSDNGELGTSKVQDIRRIAKALLDKHGGEA